MVDIVQKDEVHGDQLQVNVLINFIVSLRDFTPAHNHVYRRSYQGVPLQHGIVE